MNTLPHNQALTPAMAETVERGRYPCLFRLHDNTVIAGMLVVDATYANRPVRRYFQGEMSIYELSDISVFCDMPSEEDGLWHSPSEFPATGERIFFWDSDEVREQYSGPYWNSGEFGTENSRFQGASGPFVSGHPWASIKSWASLSELGKRLLEK